MTHFQVKWYNKLVDEIINRYITNVSLDQKTSSSNDTRLLLLLLAQERWLRQGLRRHSTIAQSTETRWFSCRIQVRPFALMKCRNETFCSLTEKIPLPRRSPVEVLSFHCFVLVRIRIYWMPLAMKMAKWSSMTIWSLPVGNLFFWIKCWPSSGRRVTRSWFSPRWSCSWIYWNRCVNIEITATHGWMEWLVLKTESKL